MRFRRELLLILIFAVIFGVAFLILQKYSIQPKTPVLSTTNQLSSPTPSPSSPLDDTNVDETTPTQACQSNSDCQNGDICTQTGPIVASPGLANKKVCLPKDSAAPF